MAKYKAKPFYTVIHKEKKVNIKFNHKGEYETEKKQEITALNQLVPIWIQKGNVEKGETENIDAEK